MDYELLRITIIVLVSVALYALLARGLFLATEPARNRALDIYERFAAIEGVSSRQKEMMLKAVFDVHSSRKAWSMAVVMFFAAFAIPLGRRSLISSKDDGQVGIPVELRAEHERFIKLWLVSVMGNSPAAALLFVFCVILLVAFSVSLSAIVRLVAPNINNHTPHTPGKPA